MISLRARVDTIPPKAGHVVAAAVWKFDHGRKLWRLMQVCYEPRKRKEREVDAPQVSPRERRRQGLLL